jgi:hypothetical protein
VEEARGLVSRAEVLLSSAGSHPLSSEVRSNIQALNSLISEGNGQEIEDKMDDLLRLVTELEAAG